MKIEINLGELLTDEFGNQENLAETIKAEIISRLSKTLEEGINKKVNEEIAALIDEQVKKVVECQMPSLLSELIDKEYTVVDKYGSRKETTTLRNQLLKTLTEQMVYKKCNYNSDKNYFTHNIDSLVETKMSQFKKEFNEKVNETLVKDAFTYAIGKLNKLT